MSLFDFLPDGLLAKWQLLVATAALFNTAQNFATLSLTRRIYNTTKPAEPVTALQARTFAVWTLTSAVVRLYAAYHIHEKTVYDMALFTYFIAFGHFGSEIFIFRTARLLGPALNPVIVSTVSLVWMITQYNHYILS